MPDLLKLGPFMIKTEWLVIGIGGLISYWLMKFILKQSLFNEKKVLDVFFNGLMIIILVWKFGPLVIQPTLLQNPFNIFFVTGTIEYIWAGMVLAVAYLFFKARKIRTPIRAFCDIFSFGFLSWWVFYSLLLPQYGDVTTMPWGISIENPNFHYHPINWYGAIGGVVVLVWLWRKKETIGNGMVFAHFLILFGNAQLITSFFKPETVYLLGLSLEQAFYICMVLVGFLYPIKGDSYKEAF